MAVQIIDTAGALEEFLDDVPAPTTGPPAWFIDLEGNNLSRQGTLSLMTVLIKPRGTIYIVDITTLGQTAFTTSASNERTLKDILESKDIVKVFFDVRNDSDALFSHFGIRVNGIQDVQLMELATRRFNRRCVNGLGKCIEQDSGMDLSERRRWEELKQQGRRLFAPEQGGSFSVFDDRPLRPDIIEYCAQDVQLLPVLREVYRATLCDAWWKKIQDETQARISLSQSRNYNGKGRHMALGPPSWMHWLPSAAERGSRTLLDSECQSQPATSTLIIASKSENLGLRSAPDMPEAMVNNSPGPIVQAVVASALDEDKSVNDPGCQSENDRMSIARSEWSSGDDESESPRDFTACDRDCGFCGHCGY